MQGIRSERVPEVLWMEICNTVQEMVIKTICKKKNCKRQNGFLGRLFVRIAEKRRDSKGKGEKERYPSECRVPKNSKER